MPELATPNMPEPEETAAMHQRMTQLFRDFYNHGTPSKQRVYTQHYVTSVTSEGDNHDNKD